MIPKTPPTKQQYNNKPVNKGSVVAMLSQKEYIKEPYQQLKECVYYRTLPTDPTSQYMTEVKQCVDSM